ncbi:MAG: FISUMP domain-containing protein [Bacteroidota bacterium]
MPQNDVNIFIAYSREDADLLSELKTHLVILERTQNVKVWYDGLIEAGTDWQSEIKDALHSADIILLLISADFIASDYCYEQEMTQALDLHSQGKVIAIPIILRECLWHRTPFAKLQALPKDGRPVASANWDTPERPYVQIVEALEQKIDDIRKARQNKVANEAARLNKQESERKFKAAVLAGDKAKAEGNWKLAKEQYEQAANYHSSDFGITLNDLQQKIKSCEIELRPPEIKSAESGVFAKRKLLIGAGSLIAVFLLTFIGVNIFTKKNVTVKGPAYKRIADMSGVTHQTTLINDLYWMTENLSVETLESWCYDGSQNCNNYFGRFYTWRAARGACPAPFRLPTHAEWSKLINSFDSQNSAFIELSSKGTTGFDATLGGYGVLESRSSEMDKTGYYWASDPDQNGHPYFVKFDYQSQNDARVMMKSDLLKNIGFSCRCVIDDKTIRLAETEAYKTAFSDFNKVITNAKELFKAGNYKSASEVLLKAIATVESKPNLPINTTEAKLLVEECNKLLGSSTGNNSNEVEVKLFPKGVSASYRHPRGMVIKTIIIEDQEWLVENVRNVLSGDESCYDKEQSNCEKFGSLLDYNTARRSCSSLSNGWRLPSNKDWEKLGSYYGGLSNDSGRQSVYDNLMARGLSKMNILLAGHKSNAGRYSGLGATGYYWSSSPDSGNAYYFVMRGKSTDLKSGGNTMDLNSCRCVRDAN